MAGIWTNELTELVVLANHFHAIYTKMIKADDAWDSIFNGTDAADFANRNINPEVQRWEALFDNYYQEKHEENDELS